MFRSLKQARAWMLVTLLVLLMSGAVSAQEATTSAIECKPGFRLFTHALLWQGTPDGVCIPEQPQRIAYSWIFHIPALLRGGFPLAGIGNQAYVAGQFPAWKDVAEGIPEISLPPNLESTLAVSPDLIIEPSWAADENYDEVSAIAPTVAFQFDGTHQWKQLAEMYFDLAGKHDAYEMLLAEYEARAKELGRLIGNPEQIKVSLVWIDETLNVETNYSAGGITLSDVGLSRPESQVFEQTPEEILAADEYPYFKALSWEEAQEADGDLIILFGDFDTGEGKTALEEVQARPVWQALTAVQADKVYVTSVNWAGGDLAGAHLVLDDIARAFGVDEQLSPNPYRTVMAPLPEIAATPEAG